LSVVGPARRGSRRPGAMSFASPIVPKGEGVQRVREDDAENINVANPSTMPSRPQPRATQGEEIISFVK